MRIISTGPMEGCDWPEIERAVVTVAGRLSPRESPSAVQSEAMATLMPVRDPFNFCILAR